MTDDATLLVERSRAGEVRVADTVDAALERIAAWDPSVRAFSRVDAEEARRRAAKLDRARSAGRPLGPLFGVPVAVKSNLCIRGRETHCGSRLLAGYRPPYTAAVVERLLAADAIVLGHTHMDEFGMGSSGENSGFDVSTNPWDATRSAGGSSSGSAAAVAAGFAPLALGSDTGGSVRQPASFCGVSGLKPTYGRVSRYGLIAYGSSLDQVGPLACSVRDLQRAFGVLAGPDPRDATSEPSAPDAACLEAPLELAGRRIGVPRELFGEALDDGVRGLVESALAEFEGLGAELVDVSLPHVEHAVATYYVVATAEASSNLARFEGVRFGRRAAGDGTLAGMMAATREAGFGEEVKRRILLGTFVLSSGYSEAWYGRAQRVRELLARDFEHVFGAVDLLAGPTAPTPAFALGRARGGPAGPVPLRRPDGPRQPGRPARRKRTRGVRGCGRPPRRDVAAPRRTPADRPPRRRRGALGPRAALPGVERSPPRTPAARARERRRPPMSAAREGAFVSARSGATWLPVIGLEVHCQLRTQSKLFCGCANRFGAPPNTLACPVCSGQPGALPVLNAAALELAWRAGIALGAELAERSSFDRKNYFYCDLPKGYQITQLREPFCTGGGIDLRSGHHVRLARIHLEEDAGKAIHDRGETTLVDLNRAGIPLIESVTEPDLRSADEAFEYLTALKEILRFAGVSDCDMEKGSLRCDVNVSVRPAGDPLRTKVELKNLNSFRNVRRAIVHEIERQVEAYESGDEARFPVQETRLFDADAGVTRSMRTKEDAEDYRYFPEPDVPGVEVDAERLAAIRSALPELPGARRARYVEELGLSAYDAGVLTGSPAVSDLFDETVRRGADPKTAANWITNEVLAAGDGDPDAPALDPEALAGLLGLVEDGRVGRAGAKQILERLLQAGGDPEAWLRELGLEQVQDGAQLEAWCRAALVGRETVVKDVRSGNAKALGALMGPVMAASKGKADPKQARAILLRLIEEGA